MARLEEIIELLNEEYDKCPDETPVACVIVSKNGKVLAHTHNRFPRGLAVTEERLANDAKASYTLHAETLAVYHAMRHFPSKEILGATVYVKGKCVCHNCANLLIEVGVSEVLCPIPDVESRWVESNKNAITNLSEAGVSVVLGYEYLDSREEKTQEEELLAIRKLGDYLANSEGSLDSVKVVI